MNSFSAPYPKSDHLRDGVRSHVNHHLQSYSGEHGSKGWQLILNPRNLLSSPVMGSSEAEHRGEELSAYFLEAG